MSYNVYIFKDIGGIVMAIKDIDGTMVFYISEEDRKALKKRAFPKGRVKTLNYHGTKRAWIEEFEAIYNYVCNNYKTNALIDCFGGSGFLSLLGARTGLFTKIHLNEIEYSAVNFHYVMQDEALFSKFLYYVYKLDKDMFKLVTKRIKLVDDGTGHYKIEKVKRKKEKYKRIQVRKPNVRKAVYLYMVRHYAYRSNGDYVKQSKDANDYNEELKKTHALYQKIKLTQLYYKKVMLENIDKINALIILDPPYLNRDIIKKNPYVCNFTVRQHRYLLQELTKKSYKSKIILCGYDDKMYNHYFELFNKRYGTTWYNLKVMRLGKRKNIKVHEHIWINFDPAGLLSARTKEGKLMFKEVSMLNSLQKKHKMKYTKLHIKNATFKKVNL